MLKVFDDAGARPHGVEPAVELAGTAIGRGISTFPGFFSPAIAARLEEEHGRAAVVVAPNVLSHSDDLIGFLEGVQALLARDGVFSFEVPYLLDIVERGLFDAIRHEQLDYHAVGPLRRFFHSCDMELVAVERIDSQGGRLRGFAQRLGGPHPADTSIEELIAAESGRHLDRPETIRGLTTRIQTLKAKLSSVLAEFKAKGRRIAGFGAPAKATTLLYQLELGPDTLDFIVDDSRWKHGLYTPGLQVPILPPEALYERRPDVVLILAWDFAESIVARHAAYRDAGGRFLVPLPAIRTL